MASTDVRKDALGIVNEVERKLGVGESTNFKTRKLTTVLLDFLNDVLDEVSDAGDWPQMFREVTVTAQSSVGAYEVAVSSQVKSIYEIHFGSQVAPLENRKIEDLRRLQRLASYGQPRQFAVTDVSGANPKFRVYPIPGSNEVTNGDTFDIAYYKKPRLITTASADTSVVPAFLSRMLVQGVYAKALAEEAGGEPTNQSNLAFQEYARMRREALNRFTSDTGTDCHFVPTGGRF